MPDKKQQHNLPTNAGNKFTVKQMVELQRIQEEIAKINSFDWTTFLLIEVILKNAIFTMSRIMDTEKEAPSESWFYLCLVLLPALPLAILSAKLTGAIDAAKKVQKILERANQLMKKTSPSLLTAQIIETSQTELDANEIEKNIDKLKDILELQTNHKSKARFASRVLASVGLAEMLMPYFSSNYKFDNVFFFVPPIVKNYNHTIFYIESVVHTLQLLQVAYHYYYRSHQTELNNAKKHHQELQSIFVTKQWERNTKPFHHFSLKANVAQMPIQLAQRTDTMQISSELFLRTIARQLLKMKLSIIFFSDQQIVVRDWGNSSINTEEFAKSFHEFLSRVEEIAQYKSDKTLQIKQIINSCGLSYLLASRSVEFFEDNGFPQVQFLIALPPADSLSEPEKNQILALKVKLTSLYGDENIIASDETISIRGCACASVSEIESICKTEVKYADVDSNISNSNNNNESFKRKTNKDIENEKKKEQEQPLTKKFRMIRDNILSKKDKLNADEIARNLTGQAAEITKDKVLYHPLAVPDRHPGNTYSLVNKTTLKAVLRQKDEKNYENNKKDLKQCFNKIATGHVSNKNIMPTNELFTKGLPNNSNNNNAPSKWLTQSYYKVTCGKVSLYATSSRKIALQQPQTDVDCVEFDRVQLSS